MDTECGAAPGVIVAKVAVGAAKPSIDQPYDYLVPARFAEEILPGMRVMVPFGNGNRRTEGIVLKLTEGLAGKKLKSVASILDTAPVLDDRMIRLGVWMRDRYLCTFYDAARAMLPAGMWHTFRASYRVCGGGEAPDKAGLRPGSDEAGVFGLLSAGEEWFHSEDIASALGKSPEKALKKLCEMGLVIERVEPVRGGARDKTVKTARLIVDGEEAERLALLIEKKAPLRCAAIRHIASMGETSVKEICYYTGASSKTLHSLKNLNIIEFGEFEAVAPIRAVSASAPCDIELNREQTDAYDGISCLLGADGPRAALLHGVTGSGKTQVYIKLIKDTISLGRQSIVMVPEISLTPQLMRIFYSHFGDRVAILHSGLGISERYEEWKRIKRGAADVVVGTRSAVFAPLANIGLIVIDEEQEHTYKSENTPRYRAIDVAKFRCMADSGLLLLGSATPSIESMHSAREGRYGLFEINRRYNERNLPEVIFADMRDELKNENGSVISAPLKIELEKNINRGEQSILFINRRGSARQTVCVECGETPRCKNCSVSLSYHSVNRRLMCHYCGYSVPVFDYCGSCDGRMKFVGAGTQRAQEELLGIFPGIEVIRMDSDTTGAKNSHEKMLDRFRKGCAQVLLGTQMVTKGLDFENVTLVGVLAADLSLYVDDFRAAERTFSLICQVVGRAGRGEKPGRAVIQTYSPKNSVLLAASQQDYKDFFDAEIRVRRALNFPPFCDLVRLTTQSGDEHAALRSIIRLRGMLERTFARERRAGALEILGPAPATVAKIKSLYRFNLIIKCAYDRAVRSGIAGVLKDFASDRQNRGVSAYADLDPVD